MYIENESELELEPKFRPGDIVKTPTREEFLTKFGFVEVEEDDGEGGISKELYKYDKDGNELNWVSFFKVGITEEIVDIGKNSDGTLSYFINTKIGIVELEEKYLTLEKRESDLRFKEGDYVLVMSVKLAKEIGVWEKLSESEKEVLKRFEKTYQIIRNRAYVYYTECCYREDFDKLNYHYGYETEDTIREFIPDVILLPDPVIAIKNKDKEMLNLISKL